MAKVRLKVNGRRRRLDVDPETPLLWALRDHLGLTGTKYGCGISVCGACTVLVDGEEVRSCVTSVGDVSGSEVTTIEGFGRDSLHVIQQAWIDEEVPQCGWCQSGQILAAAALLESKPKPTDADIDEAMDGVICRCGTYPRIRKAIHRAAGNGKGEQA